MANLGDALTANTNGDLIIPNQATSGFEQHR